MKREEARKDINGRPLTDFIPLEMSRKAGSNMYKCPVCKSGTGRNGTGALRIYPDSNRVVCFSGGCFTNKGEDTLGALRTIWKCEETEALKRAGYSLDYEAPAPAHQEHKKNTEHQEHKPEAADYSLFYRKWHEDLKASPEALEYLHGRGITDDSIERFNLGYCATWKHSKAGERVQPSRRIIIPRTKGTYTARNIDKPRNEWEEDYTKQVQGSQKSLFNLEALDGAETPIICEGELDAISLYQAGAASVVGIGTTSNREVFVNEAKKHPEAVFVLALDNDPPEEETPDTPARKPWKGQKTQKWIAEQLTAAGLAVLSIDPAKIYGEAKDGNEAFTKDPERLEKVIAHLQEKAQEMKAGRDEEREAELRKRTGEGMLEDFLLTVTDKDKRTFEGIKTGIKDFDRALEGGFIRRTITTLGGAPGMGKTAIMQWLLENMARNGNDILYINLEMDRAQLLARSLSRLAWNHSKKDFSALDILRGYAWTDEDREIIMQAANIYKVEIAPHFIYNPDGVTNNINSILSAMEAETARIKAQGKPEPLICIDYLQLIDSGEKDTVEGIKNVIKKLKDFAKNHNTVVFLITANNRASNKSGVSDMESGRDTSAIEYSGDIMLGLSYTAIEDRRKYECGEDANGNPRYAEYDLETIRRMKREARDEGKPVPSVCNEISLKVMKSRFTEDEHRVNLIFDGKHATFNLTEWKYNPVRISDHKQPEDKNELGEEWEIIGTQHQGKRNKKRKALQEAYAQAKQEADAAGTDVTLYALAELLDVSQSTVKSRIKEYGGFTISKDETIVFDGEIDVSSTVEKK